MREIMLIKRITQEELSKRTGIKQSEISLIINDRQKDSQGPWQTNRIYMARLKSPGAVPGLNYCRAIALL
jgi:transcriptional regulator with XRE-family HTH domain